MPEIIFQSIDADTSPDTWAKLGANTRASAARGIFASNLDAQGNLNERKFYQDIAKAGLGPEDAKTAMDWQRAGKAADVNTAQANTQLEALGYKPQAAGRAGASIGEPAPVEVPAAPAAAPKRDRLEEWFAGLRGEKAAAPQPSAEEQIAAQQAAPPGGAVAQEVPSAANLGSLGSSSLGTMTLPPLPEGAGASPTTLRPGQDLRTARQKVEDSYDPANSPMARAQAAAGAPAGEGGMFDWNAMDNGTNQFQQFQQALGAKLKSIGAVTPDGTPDPGAYLRQIYTATIQANMPPAPNPALMAQGLEGMVKYEGEVQAYQAALTKAKGAAEQAVLKAKDDLAAYAKQFGVDTVEQRRSEIGGGMLMDPAKRTEAAALITNRQNIANAAQAVEASVDATGPNVTKLMLAAPQVIRAYATALNPGQQLNEGNLLEVSRVMYPELSRPHLIQIAAALGRGIRNNDWSGFKTVADAVDATAPQALYDRMRKVAEEAAKLNQISLGSYVTPGARQPAPAESTEEKLGKALGIGKRSGPKVGDEKTIGGVTGVWDGKTWRRK